MKDDLDYLWLHLRIVGLVLPILVLQARVILTAVLQIGILTIAVLQSRVLLPS
jgi:hypothetical protein